VAQCDALRGAARHGGPHSGAHRPPQPRPPSPEAWSDWAERPLTPRDASPNQDLYDGSIARIDAEGGWLLRDLARQRRLDNTIVIITSDHGDELGEHGMAGHGGSLDRLSLHVALVVWFPVRVPQGSRVTAAASLRNLAATVLDLTGVGEPSPLPGRSLARFWMTRDAALTR